MNKRTLESIGHIFCVWSTPIQTEPPLLPRNSMEIWGILSQNYHFFPYDLKKKVKLVFPVQYKSSLRFYDVLMNHLDLDLDFVVYSFRNSLQKMKAQSIN